MSTKIIKNKKNTTTENDSSERVSFILPSINRDQQIWLGQSIIALIGVNLPFSFTEKQNKEDLGLMFIDILKHYGISIEELYKMDVIENKLDQDCTYEISVDLKYKILSKRET